MKKIPLAFRKEAGRLHLCRYIGMGLFLSCFCPAVYAGSLDKKVTVKVKNMTLQDAIAMIMKQTDYGISYNVDEISDIKNVSFEVKDVSVDDALKACLAPYGFTYTVHDQTVVISAIAQIDEIKGIVVDENGEPLIGVSIIGRVKNKEVSREITNMDGRFSIKLPGGVN